MAKRISQKEIYDNDLYSDLKKSAESVLPLLEQMNKLLVGQSKETNKLINVEATNLNL